MAASGPAAVLNPFRFSSEVWDDTLGLADYTFRPYNPLDGRFLNRDPISERRGLNLYGFVGNDPVNRWDVLGKRGSSPWPGMGQFYDWHPYPYNPRFPPSNGTEGNWSYSSVWNFDTGWIDVHVFYRMDEKQQKCCKEVTVDRYIGKVLGFHSKFGPYVLDQTVGGAWTTGAEDGIPAGVGRAEGDSPEGPGGIFGRLPWTHAFLWKARCTKGARKGEILDTLEKWYQMSWHWHNQPYRGGFY
jgi:RHS repeat-associated protein